MKQLLMYLREKTLQDRQQALFLEFHGRGITRLLIVVFICWHQRRKRKLLIDQYDHRLERSVCVARDYPDAFPQSILILALHL